MAASLMFEARIITGITKRVQDPVSYRILHFV
jgi:hypothetical protein